MIVKIWRHLQYAYFRSRKAYCLRKTDYEKLGFRVRACCRSGVSVRISRQTRGSAGFLLGGLMPLCRLRRRTFWKFDYEMVHSEVYLNKYVVSIAPFSTTAFKIFRKLLFCVCSLFNFSSIFPGGSADPICPYVLDAHAIDRYRR